MLRYVLSVSQDRDSWQHTPLKFVVCYLDFIKIATVLCVKNHYAITKEHLALFSILSSQIPDAQKCVRSCKVKFSLFLHLQHPFIKIPIGAVILHNRIVAARKWYLWQSAHSISSSALKYSSGALQIKHSSFIYIHPTNSYSSNWLYHMIIAYSTQYCSDL